MSSNIAAGIVARAIAGAFLLLGSGCMIGATTGVAFAQGADIVADADGMPITAHEIEQGLKLGQLATNQEPSRAAVIAQLREERRRRRVAQEAGVDVADADVEAAYAGLAKRAHLTPEQLTSTLVQRGVDEVTMKRRIRADLAWMQYVRRRHDGTLLRVYDHPLLRKPRDDAPTWQE